jgi:hypothetical protein
LLLSLPALILPALLTALADSGVPAVEIGEVLPPGKPPIAVGRVFAPPFKSQTPGDAVGTTGHRRVFFKLGRIF